METVYRMKGIDVGHKGGATLHGAPPNCTGERGQVGLEVSLFLSVHQTVIRRQTSGAKKTRERPVHPAHEEFLDRESTDDR